MTSETSTSASASASDIESEEMEAEGSSVESEAINWKERLEKRHAQLTEFNEKYLTIKHQKNDIASELTGLTDDLQGRLDDWQEENPTYSEDDDGELTNSLGDILGKIFSGSSNQALWADTIAFWFGFAAVAMGGKIAAQMPGLDPFAKGLLSFMPIILGGLARLPLGVSVDKNGGTFLTKIYLWAATFSLLGMGILTSATDISDVDSMGDPKYIATAGGLFVVGLGIAIFSMITNVMKWAPSPEISKRNAALFGGLGNTGPGVLGFVLLGLITAFGLNGAFFFMTGIMALATILLSFKGFGLVDTFYHQLKAMGCSEEMAKEFCELLGQINPPKSSDQPYTDLFALLKDIRVWLLILNYFWSFGNFVGLSGALNLTFRNAFGYSPLIATLITSIVSLSSALLRSASAWVLEKDPTKGSYINLISSLVATLGALIIGTTKDVPSLGRMLTGLAMIAAAYGFSANMTMALMKKWSDEPSSKMSNLPLPKVGAHVACWGTYGSILISVIAGYLANLYGDIGYTRAFLVPAVLSFLTGIGVTGFDHWFYSETAEVEEEMADLEDSVGIDILEGTSEEEEAEATGADEVQEGYLQYVKNAASRFTSGCCGFFSSNDAASSSDATSSVEDSEVYSDGLAV